MQTSQEPQDVVDHHEPPTTGVGEAWPMAMLITGDGLRGAVEDGFIKHGNSQCVEGAKYDFRLSPQILKASFGQPVDIEKLSEMERASVTIEPGEVVFVRTIEELDLPENIIAVLSPKRKISHAGIIALGGFCIDPLYRGPLWLGLYNVSSTPFVLRPRKKLIAALFYQLSDEEQTHFPTPETTTEGEFPDDLITLIKNYKPVELTSLADAVANLESQLTALTTEVREDRDWKGTFRESLEKQSRQIDKLLEGLREEKDARKQEDETIRTRLDKMSGLFFGAKMIWIVIALISGAFLSALFDLRIPELFKGD
jgi:deoxycytidine triphosphate deaminase